MNERLSSRSQQLVRSALASETAPGAAKRAKIKRAVLAVATVPGAATAAGLGTAKAAGAAGAGTMKAVALKLLPWASAGSFGAKVTGATLIAMGAVAAGTQILPVGGEAIVSEKAATSASSVSATKGSSSGISVNSAIGVPVKRNPAVEVVPEGAEPGRALSAGELEKKRGLAPEAAEKLAGQATSNGPIAAKPGERRQESLVGSHGQDARHNSSGPLPGSEHFPATPEAPEPSVVRTPKGVEGALPPLRGESGKSSGAKLQLHNELAELEAVQALLRSGRGAAALELLDSRGNKGALLTEERLASEVFAACQVGNVSRAGRAAQAFLARAPGSILAARIRRSCAFGPQDRADSNKSRH